MRFTQHLNFLWHYFRDEDVANIPLTTEDKKYVDYYCKIMNPVEISQHTDISHVPLFKTTGSSYDFHRIIPQKDPVRFKYRWGDLTIPPDQPTFVKNRKILEIEGTSVLLPLNTGRNYFRINDSKQFTQKRRQALWRGSAFKVWRKEFLKAVEHISNIDAKDTQPINKGMFSKVGRPNYMSIRDQLNYQFLISIEGNDAATNIKWILQSNSVLMMPRPRFETWFCEGLLEPGRHFIEFKPDYSDINDVFENYASRPKLCQEIINEAKEFSSFFFPIEKQFAIAREVVRKYKDLTTPL